MHKATSKFEDTVFIEGLSFLASIGVFDWEKQFEQKLVLDLELSTDTRPAAASDDLNLALNYAAVSELVINLAQSQHHDLIETLAEKIASQLLHNFNTQQVSLTLRKPSAVPAAASVGVKITRQRQEPTL
ncbi:dihydroneopterin aldolase [Marinospirillum insulare]|uniref:7,8-dihydroneopterin aldolase n=1 Tax=Marinospirillum insulare TaxID=217169 RepID=A0ABQ5ZSB7_9GAMM|nr:dihydroneopterin aldolase [Marinospirillum insulare]GLR63024.1 7,8-dihydroneopterin aldolase [Marinospirillum insulare]